MNINKINFYSNSYHAAVNKNTIKSFTGKGLGLVAHSNDTFFLGKEAGLKKKGVKKELLFQLKS